MKKLIVALIAGAAAMSAAQAQTATTAPRTYVGVGAATATTEGGLGDAGSKTSAKIFGGYEIDQTWGVEAGYTDFRKNNFSNGSTSGNTKGYGVYVAGKATAPINDQFSAYGKVGIQHSNRELNATNLHLSDSDNGVYAGVGVQYNLNQQVALTAEYERYGKSKSFGAKPDVWTVGAKYSF